MKIVELALMSAAGVVMWLLSFLSYRNRQANRAQQDSFNATGTAADFFKFLKSFAFNGGLQNVFPGDDSRDTSIQFELISTINCTTSLGKPISLTVRNTPQDRRRMRLFGSF